MLWGLRRVEPQATYGIAVDRLKRQIHSGLLLPAEKLPAERQLSDDFGISRVTLREALRVLETDHYIIVKRGAYGGAFVTDEDRLADMSKRRITREPASAMRVLEFLCTTELAAAGYAADRRTLPELKRMRRAMTLMAEAASLPLLKQSETFFHLALGDASHNNLLSRAIEDALAELFLPFVEPSFADLQSRMIAQHLALFTAIDRGDSVLAHAAIATLHEGYWTKLRTLTRSAA
jgi:GntR family transcriptional regulator, transcriptional repressor for pyruvate dehydrogenase complex